MAGYLSLFFHVCIMRLQSVRSLKVLTLLDNMVYSSGPLAHWGYSSHLSYVDAEGVARRVLMDTGSDAEAFLRNAKLLDVDFRSLDSVVLSHGHFDHTSTTVQVAEAKPGIRIYANPAVFSERHVVDEKGKRRILSPPAGEGLKELKAAGAKIIFNKEPVEVSPGAWATGETPRRSFETVMELGKNRLVRKENGNEVGDTIPDDQSLFLNQEGFGVVVLTGCAHSGLLNTLAYVEELTGEKPRAVIGGTHLIERKPEYTAKTIEGLRSYNLKILSPGHCTGFKAIGELALAFPEAFQLSSSGKTIDFDEFLKKQIK
jgi:7,8-dihydropterin-6-yl-methyl-4-(beta-D-ribofuranosyl)aminobenzene 5'-phosphate synthase